MFREYKVQEKLKQKTILYLDLRSPYLSIVVGYWPDQDQIKFENKVSSKPVDHIAVHKP